MMSFSSASRSRAVRTLAKSLTRPVSAGTSGALVHESVSAIAATHRRREADRWLLGIRVWGSLAQLSCPSRVIDLSEESFAHEEARWLLITSARAGQRSRMEV